MNSIQFSYNHARSALWALDTQLDYLEQLYQKTIKDEGYSSDDFSTISMEILRVKDVRKLIKEAM